MVQCDAPEITCIRGYRPANENDSRLDIYRYLPMIFGTNKKIFSDSVISAYSGVDSRLPREYLSLKIMAYLNLPARAVSRIISMRLDADCRGQLHSGQRECTRARFSLSSSLPLCLCVTSVPPDAAGQAMRTKQNEVGTVGIERWYLALDFEIYRPAVTRAPLGLKKFRIVASPVCTTRTFIRICAWPNPATPGTPVGRRAAARQTTFSEAEAAGPPPFLCAKARGIPFLVVSRRESVKSVVKQRSAPRVIIVRARADGVGRWRVPPCVQLPRRWTCPHPRTSSLRARLPRETAFQLQQGILRVT